LKLTYDGPTPRTFKIDEITVGFPNQPESPSFYSVTWNAQDDRELILQKSILLDPRVDTRIITVDGWIGSNLGYDPRVETISFVVEILEYS